MNEFFRRLLFLPEQASTMAPVVDRLHYFVITVTMLGSFAVGAWTIFSIVRWRRTRELEVTPHVEPRWWFEVTAVGVPSLLFLAWFFIGFLDFVVLDTPPKNAMEVYAMGKQWMWKFAYPEGPSSVSVLHVPAKRPVKVLLTSRDVIHSFYVPAFRIKKDVVPGRYTEVWFEATEPGRYQILCAEYCGLNHSTMWGEVVVMKPEDFDAWLDRQRRGLARAQDSSTTDSADAVAPASSLVEQGRLAAARHGCFKCHTVDGQPHIGPTWLDLYRRKTRLQSGLEIVADEAYLTESMMDPLAKLVAGFAPVMPTFQGRLSGGETAAIVEFIKSLRSDRLEAEPVKGPEYEPTRR